MEKDSHVRIFLDSIEVSLKLGVLAHEQDKPQRVMVTAEVFADPRAYLQSVHAETIIDYGVLHKAVTSWADRPQVLLIEDYLNEFLDLCFSYEGVTACGISIKKLDIFGQNQGAGVEVFTQRGDWEPKPPPSP